MNLVDELGVIDLMKRLLIHVEGETEEDFVHEVLSPYLTNKGYSRVEARIIGNSRQRHRRGGIRGWDTVRKDIIRHLKEDPHSFASTMVDYYGLPIKGNRAWPGREISLQFPFPQKADVVQDALLQDIRNELGNQFNPRRFIPFVMMHEFEGLLFSDCKSLSKAVCQPQLEKDFYAIRSEFSCPEEINDSPETAPSKRIKALIPDYEKPILGILAILEIGLDTIRQECPNFNRWLLKLEAA